ncbi:MAG: bifunctional diguanylate cyclase/phosphodiesterase, partial [Bacillota bacterium]
IIYTISNTVNDILKSIIFENQNNAIKRNTELVDHWISDFEKKLEIYANTEIMKKGSWKEKKNYLQTELTSRLDEYFFFFMADTDGNYSTTLRNDAGNISNREYFPKIMEDKTIISDPVISKSTSEAIIVIGTPIKNNGEIEGMLAATVKLSELSSYINRFNNNENVYSFLINGEGKIIAHPDQDKLYNQLSVESDNEFILPDKVITNVLNNESGNFACNLNNNSKYAFHHELGINDWEMVTILPQSHLQERIDELNKKILIISIIAIILGSIASIYIANSISKPLVKLKNIFQKGAKGNLSIRADIDSNDEIGKVAQSFNKMMEVITDLTYNDSLTGFTNIEFFRNNLENTLNHLEDIDESVYICSLGIDDFKSINDRFGYNGGDKIIKKIAKRLSYYFKEGQSLSRIGDEFYFFLINSEKDINIYDECKNILENINQSYIIDENIVHLTASMGISIYPDDSNNANKLIKNASLAMHGVKENNIKKIAFYSKNKEQNLSERKKLESELSEALDNEEFVLHYQPFISTENEKIIGMEALIRWEHPEKGMISPGIFIPIAEKTSLISKMGDLVLNKACSDLKSIHENISDNFFVSVNVSPEQFLNSNFVDKIKETLFNTGLEPEHLELEITERTAMGNIEYTIDVLQELHDLGIKIAMDDFGTGYSSLSYLKEFAIDILKIDKSFIDDFLNNEGNKAIVNTIINIAHNLDLKVVAEGVERKEQAEKLKEYGCDIIQGYYYSKPQAKEKLFEELK